MNIAVIGADEESVHAIEQAHRLGHRVIAVDNDPRAAGAVAADVHHRIDISHADEVIEALKGEDIDFVMTTPIGRHICTIGAVNDALGLPGVSRDSAAVCSDKYEFHNRLRNRKLRDGHCYLVTGSHPVDPSAVDYPAVFKPRYGSHGRSVHYLYDEDGFADLQAAIWGPHESEPGTGVSGGSAAEFARNVKLVMEERLRQASPEDDPGDEYIIEEALAGTEYAVDGFVEGCNFEVILIRRKTLTPPPARQAVSYMVIMPGEDGRVEEMIRSYMGRICEVLGLKDCMLHADLCILGRTVNAIEISASPAGRHVYDELIPMATGVDPSEQYLRYMAGGSHYFQPLNMKRMMLRYFDMEHCFVHGIPDRKTVESRLPEGVRLRVWHCNMKLLDYLGSINDEESLLRRGYYICEGTSEKVLEEAAAVIRDSFELK
ncbi:MAG: ATP-grasp domain-containing protein [Lachnospiraceae bacterium]|nr:ATP-grasp domain-containing protein [Lachnospiraceae bacterium]